MSEPLRVALIGFGAIGRSLAMLIRDRLDVILVGIAKASAPTRDDCALAGEGIPFVQTPGALADLTPDVAVECAGHQALAQFGPEILDRGANLVVASVGALADPGIETALREHARSSGARVLIPSGALGGLDVLSAARFGGLESVTYAGRKPFRAWLGTPAERLIESNADSSANLLIFEGTAREAAREYPKNANVTAAVAIAGLGFDATRVQLYAGSGQGNEHCVRAQGSFGSFEITVRANALPANPKSSLLAPCSIARSIANLRATIALA